MLVTTRSRRSPTRSKSCSSSVESKPFHARVPKSCWILMRPTIRSMAASKALSFHGYYRHYCYLPLYCFCGNIPLFAKLRDCKRDASDGTVEALQKIVPAIRQRFGKKVRIIVRADSGFAREAIMAWCEENHVFYCLGLARNDRLAELLKTDFEALRAQIKETKVETPCRSFTEFEYSTLDSWTKARRVIGKAEILSQGDNPRFIVTNLAKDGWATRTQ